MQLTVSEVEGCYAVPNISARGYLCKTNLPPYVVMRGAGVPQAILITEHWIRAVAEFLNVPVAKVNKRKHTTMWHCLLSYSGYYHASLLQKGALRFILTVARGSSALD